MIQRHRFRQTEVYKQAKPFTLHCALLILVFAYAFLGGLVFNQLETEAVREQHQLDFIAKSLCVSRVVQNRSRPASPYDAFTNGADFLIFNTTQEEVIEGVIHCFDTEIDVRSQWSYVTATLYGFGIVTTLGYNRIAPVTLAGRLFCVIYGLCGIPMTMIIIANIGQYLNQFAGATRKNFEAYRREKRRQSMLSTGMCADDIPDSSIELMSFGLLAAFLIYVCIGAMLLPLLNGEFDFFNGIYFNFLCLTAIDFGQLVPTRHAIHSHLGSYFSTRLNVVFTFSTFEMGLAITTIAIDIGSEYLKKLHNYGKKMRNVAQAKVWFGGKTLKVRDLLHAVGKKCGVDPGVIDRMDLENIVERAVAINEGREPPPDTNEDDEPPPPKEPLPPPTPEPPPQRSPPFVIHRPVFDSISTRSHSTLENYVPSPSGNYRNLVAIDMGAGEISEQAVDWDEPLVVVGKPEQYTVEEDIADPSMLDARIPVVIVDKGDRNEAGDEETEPRRFKEKKQKYARNARKLHETYVEEWDRLEHLSSRLQGSRRRSVLSQQGAAQQKHSLPASKSAAILENSSSSLSLNEAREQRSSTQDVEQSRTPSPVRQLTPSLSPSSSSRRLLSVGEITSIPSSSRRSSSSAGIKKLSPETYKKFGEMVIKDRQE